MKKTLALAGTALLVASGAFAANTLTVVPGAAMNGTTQGLSVNLDGSTNNVYVESAHPNNETHYHARFWINPATTAINAQNKSIRIAGLGDDVAAQHVLLFLRRNGSDNSMRLNTWYKADTGSFVSGPGMFLMFQTNINQPRQVEIEWTAATAPGANDGSLFVRRLAPTTAEESITGLDTDTLQVDNYRQGLLAGSGANATGGAYHFDEFESYR